MSMALQAKFARGRNLIIDQQTEDERPRSGALDLPERANRTRPLSSRGFDWILITRV